MSQEQYIRTDESEDVAGSIRHALRCEEFVNQDPQAWKWGILALHSALQGACVCHLVTTASPVGAITKSNAKLWINYFDDSMNDPEEKPPKTDLMRFPDLLKAVRKPNSAGGRCYGQVNISNHELESLKHIHENIRNQFVHFEPQGWSIEISGVRKIGQLTARIIKEINKCGWAFRHLDPSKRNSIIHDLDQLTDANRPTQLE